MTLNQHKMKSFFFSLFLICFTSLSYAQEQDSTAVEAKTIVDEYNLMIDESGSYQEYKVIKKTAISSFRDQLTQQKEAFENEIKTLEKEISSQSEEIKTLKMNLSSTESNLAEVEEQKNSMQFFGSNVNKYVFQSIVFGIIGALVLILLIVLIKFKANSSATKDAIESLERTEKEFEEYKHNALEKQQKLGRELQDQKNKLNKLKTGGPK
jgi:preprotein translocase subunit SecF